MLHTFRKGQILTAQFSTSRLFRQTSWGKRNWYIITFSSIYIKISFRNYQLGLHPQGGEGSRWEGEGSRRKKCCSFPLELTCSLRKEPAALLLPEDEHPVRPPSAVDLGVQVRRGRGDPGGLALVVAGAEAARGGKAEVRRA